MIDDIRRAFVNAVRGRVSLERLTTAPDPDGMTITATGWYSDGRPFAFTSAPFMGDPEARAAQLATDLVSSHGGKMPAPTIGQRINHMSRLADKLKSVADSSKDMATKIEARADAFLSRKGALEGRTETAFAPHEDLLGQAENGLNEIEKALASLTNGGPPLDGSGS